MPTKIQVYLLWYYEARLSKGETPSIFAFPTDADDQAIRQYLWDAVTEIGGKEASDGDCPLDWPTFTEKLGNYGFNYERNECDLLVIGE